MAVQVLVPNLGLGSNPGRVVEWCRPDGATVAAGEPVALYECDHMIVELEAAAPGVLRHGPESRAGADCPAGNVLAVILAPGERLESVSFAVESAPVPAHPGAMPRPVESPSDDFGDGDSQPVPVLPLRRNTLPQAAPLPPDSTWAPIPGDEVAVGSDWLSPGVQEGAAEPGAGTPGEGEEAGAFFDDGPGTNGLVGEPEADAWADRAAGDETSPPAAMEDEVMGPAEAAEGLRSVSALGFLEAPAEEDGLEPSFEAADHSAVAPPNDDGVEEDLLSAFEESEREEDAAFEDDPNWEVRFATRFAAQQMPAITPPFKHHADDPRPYFDVAPYADGVTVMEGESVQADAGTEPDGGNSHTDRCDCIGTEIPEVEGGWFAAKGLAIGRNTSLCEFMVYVDPPGGVERFVRDVQPGPAFAMQGAHFPGGLLSRDQLIHFVLDIVIRFARNSPAIEIGLAL